MIPGPDSARARESEVLAERVEALAAWLSEVETRLRAAEVATGDEKTAKELRRAIQALSKHDPKLEERVGNRVDVLADRLATLASTVSSTAASTAARDGEVTALRRELEAALRRIESLATQRGRALDGGELASLRKEVATLATERSSRKVGPDTTDLARKLEYLGERIDTLAATVGTTAAGLARREGDLAQVRRTGEELAAKLEAAVTDMRLATDPALLHEVKHEVSELAARSSAMETVRAAVESEVARLDGVVMTLQHSLGALSARIGDTSALASREQLEALEGRVGTLGERVDSVASGLSSQLATSTSRLDAITASGAAHELELAAVSRGLQEANERAEAVAGELRASIEKAREPERDAALEASVAELARSLEDVFARVSRIDVSVDTALEGVAGTHDELRTELARVSAESIARADGQNGFLSDLRARLDALAGDVVRTAGDLKALDSGVEERLDALAAAAQGASSERDRELNDLRARFEDGVARVDRLVDDLRSALEDAAVAAAGRAAGTDELLRGRLDELAARVEHVEDQTGAGHTGAEDEVVRLRFLVEDLSTRLTASEREVDALRAAEEPGTRLVDLAGRLEALERRYGDEIVVPHELASGQGRFRLELRGLELRMEHAEAAARENREAVLTQLERLASKIEWRLQRLEDEAAEPPGAVTAGGQVVPIRAPEG